MIDPRPRTWFPLSIGQGMILVLIASICLAPLMSALRDPHAGRILAAFAIDLLIVPAAASIVLSLCMERGPARDWVIRAFWLTPGLVLTLSVPAILLGALWPW